MAKETTKPKPTAETNPPNIRWVGIRAEKSEPKPNQRAEDMPEDNYKAPEPKEGEEAITITPPFTEPPASISIGGEKITLPPPDVQKAGFFHKKALAIVQCMPGYKLILGGK